MNRFATSTLITAAILSALALPQIGHARATHTGTVGRVWEDGFRLHTADQTLWVDTSNLYADKTPGNINVGDLIQVTGELKRIEFDASAISVATTLSIDF
ncbi:MAG: hypothetical protein MJA27_10990 [Pseudanabaenales cyanobacterium]|nr:hypothetical protein [Pseudanabaenales cyanobacterium]